MTDREKKMFDIINNLYDDYNDLVKRILYDRNKFDYQSLKYECINLADYKIDIMELNMEFKEELKEYEVMQNFG